MEKKTLSMAILSIALISAMFNAIPIVGSDKVEEPRFLDTRKKPVGKHYYVIVSGNQRGGLYAAPNSNAWTTKATEETNKIIDKSKNLGRIYTHYGEDVDKNAVCESLKAMATAAQPGDTIVFHFTGHGAYTADTPSLTWHYVDRSVDPPVEREQDLSDTDIWTCLRKKIQPSVKLLFVLDACYGGKFKDTLSRIVTTDGKRISKDHIRVIGPSGKTLTIFYGSPLKDIYGNRTGGLITSEVLLGMENMTADTNADHSIDSIELYNYIKPLIENKDKDEDGKENEDPVEQVTYPNGTTTFLYIDNDGDGYIDEDPPITLVYPVPSEVPVGGYSVPIDIPVDKPATLLAPYFGLASTILVTTVVTAIYVKRVKRRKEKQ